MQKETATMASEQFSLCWDNFHKNMSSGMQSLLETEDLVDVTLAVEGRYLKAHKMVLSVCSPYFRELFQTNPCKHPIVFMKDVSYIALSDLLQFMYQGEVQVAQENLSTFIKTAEALQIKGLTGDSNVSKLYNYFCLYCIKEVLISVFITVRIKMRWNQLNQMKQIK